MKTNYLLLAISFVVLSCASDTSAQAIVQIASGSGVSFFVKSDGSLWRGDFGHQLALDRAGRLGNRSTFDKLENHTPYDLIIPNGVTAVAMNGQHDTFFIKQDGSLQAIGEHYYRFGPDSFQIMPNKVATVACGENFTVFLKNEGSLWGFGWNGNGELGVGDGKAETYFEGYKRIVPDGVVAIATGYIHTLYIKRDGSLWGMGNNAYGQLGQAKELNHTFSPVQIAGSNVIAVAAAHYQSYFIKSDGSLWAMGLNDWGQIGDCTIDWPYHPKQIVSNNVVAVTAGYSGAMFLKKDGSLWAMGINWHNNYGEGIEFDSRCPTQIFSSTNSAIVAGYYYNARLKTCVNLWAGKFNSTPFNLSAASATVLTANGASLPGYNLIAIEQLTGGDVRLSYTGEAGVNYALERSSSLFNPQWVSQVTNTAPNGGILVMTNTLDMGMNNFWRIRAIR